MTPISFNVQYCDDMIIHADPNKYSLIGVYNDIYPIPAPKVIIGKLAFVAAFALSLQQIKELANQPLQMEVLLNGELLSAIEAPPVDIEQLPQQNTPESFTFMFNQTINGFQVEHEQKVHVCLKAGNTVLAESRHMTFVSTS
ncbi:hypothetical protein PL75_03385 [Neisseria arctica]|uniref:Uncharacterized protein n=1 Tax=Neisseria arctica TaxID=1470200 RepID=A0A0J0YT41_9NEIS|nr:hypothetical protein [Neisseria arctica]KLT73277.1 hypothetical protein PL75_03385 [Neisseria arctica]UOO87464.1 hypothetical protein LVJ86_04265 [Neisseria arctica]